MKLSTQNRIVISKSFIEDMVPISEERNFKVFFSEKQTAVIFSSKNKRGRIVQIGKVHIDDKNRIRFTSDLVELIPKLLKEDFDGLYMCLNPEKELCIKKVP